MGKDFKNWHLQKTNIDQKNYKTFFIEREIWFCRLGSNIGFEQDGHGKKFLRPGIILKKFSKYSALIIPLTKSEKKGQYYFSFKYRLKNTKTSFYYEKTTAILSQVRFIDCKRLEYSVGIISNKIFIKIKKNLSKLIY